jgi:BirA family biotin operon repressor/biotin-[acetyl-CoA-carboxylase] ligase
MPYKLPLLRLLSDGQPRRVDDLIAALSLAPEALAPALADLLALGAPIEACGGVIRLVEPIELVDGEAVSARLPESVTLAVIDRAESTSSLVADLAREGAARGTAVACEIQTAGRGRRGSPWLAPIGGSLAFSLLWRFERAEQLSGLSLAIGVACARAFESVGAHGIGLKWPNDVLHEGRKLAGILVEIASGTDAAVVIGVGVNVRGAERLADRLPYPVADLAIAGASGGRNDALVALLTQLADTCEAFDREGFAAFRDEWERRHAWRDRPVRLAGNDNATEGTALGVADDGALLVRTGSGVERVVAGEVSLR